MTHVEPTIPTSVSYPVDRLIEKFDIDYFTSTVAFMFAWVIDHIDGLVAERLRGQKVSSFEEAQERRAEMYSEYMIGVFGIDLVVGGEYAYERPCAEFWLGEALARNIHVVIPKQSALLSQRYRYGYDVETPGLIRESDLAKRVAGLDAEHTRESEKAINLHGRVEELRSLPASVLKNEEIAARLAELERLHIASSERVINLHGQVNEARYWKHFHELRDRGAAL